MITDKQIRQAIALKIKEALKAFYGVDDSDFHIRIHDHWILSSTTGQDQNMVKIRQGEEKGKIHGWMIGLASVTREQPSSAAGDSQGARRLKLVNVNRRDTLRSYRVWCYHQLDTGTAGNESEENSENRLAAEIEAVADYFSNYPTLGIDDPQMMGHEELQFRPIDTFTFGSSLANVAQGTLDIRIQKPIRPMDT
jgi:hypothetical protein